MHADDNDGHHHHHDRHHRHHHDDYDHRHHHDDYDQVKALALPGLLQPAWQLSLVLNQLLLFVQGAHHDGDDGVHGDDEDLTSICAGT